MSGLDLLKEEMKQDRSDETQCRINAIHRLKTVILSLDQSEVQNGLVAFLDELIQKPEEDEVLYSIAEELGKCFSMHPDRTLFLGLLEQLCKHDETEVRNRAVLSLIQICDSLQDADVQNVFAPLVIKLAQHDWFPGRVSSCKLFTVCY